MADAFAGPRRNDTRLHNGKIDVWDGERWVTEGEVPVFRIELQKRVRTDTNAQWFTRLAFCLPALCVVAFILKWGFDLK